LKDAQKNEVDFSGTKALNPYKIYLVVEYKVKDLAEKRLINNEKDLKASFQYLAEVTFIKNADQNVLEWKLVTNRDASCKDSELDELIKLQNNAPQSDVSKLPQANKAAYSILQKNALACPCVDKGIKTITEANDLTTLIGILNEPPDGYLIDVLLGHISMKDPYKAEQSDLTVNLKNINSSLESLDLFEDFVRKVQALNTLEHEPLETVIKFLRAFRKNLQVNIERLKDNIRYTQNFRDFNLKKWQYKFTKDVTGGSTHSIDFMTASKFKISPDFGLVLIGNAPGKGLVHDIVPYLGFNINFRSIDKNIPMSAVRHKPWSYYLSFNAGLTLSSIKIDNKRDDLFSGKSLMGGFGLRLNNYLKVIGGGVFYKKYSLNPLSNDKSVAVSPYLGLSVDYELSELFGGINKLFK
jgi:hypothetical protein